MHTCVSFCYQMNDQAQAVAACYIYAFVYVWKAVEKKPKDLHQQIDNLSSLFMSTFHGWNFKNRLEHLFNTFFFSPISLYFAVLILIKRRDDWRNSFQQQHKTHAHNGGIAEKFVHFICHSSRIFSLLCSILF